jgi:UDP:flavonoid glycosyltransferase YjiC (YdhE family)
VSEALQYGVPIICLPLSGDQPFVAWRVADELEAGVRLQADDKLTVKKVKNAINEILDNPKYREKSKKISLISKKYRGHELAAQHIVNFIQSKTNQNKIIKN